MTAKAEKNQNLRVTTKRLLRGQRVEQALKGSSALAGSSHVTAAGGNVFSDLGFPPAEAETLKIRSRLMSEAQRVTTGMAQAEAAKTLGVSLPCVRALMRGHIDRFTIDALVNMLAHAGIKTQFSLKRAGISAA